MADLPHRKNDDPTATADTDELREEYAEMAAILEQARQNVKHLRKEELEGERITADLLNFRMDAVDGF